MPPSRPEMRVFIVNTGEVPTLHANRIEAAYYQVEDGFMTFKDNDHKAVYTVRPDHLVSIERAHGAEPLIAGLMDILSAARENGHAEGRVMTEVSESPDGVVTETGFDITISLIGGVDTTRSTAPPVEVGSINVTMRGSGLTQAGADQAVRNASRTQGIGRR
jgi:hypothetical protein